MNHMSELPLHALRGDPDREFVNRLSGRLRQQSAASAARVRRPLTQVAAALATAAAIGFALTLPSVHTLADSFLSLFRDVSFVAIPSEPDAPLTRANSLDLPHLIGERVQILEDGGATNVLTPEAASTLAGFAVVLPGFLPKGAIRTTMSVQGRHAARVTADTTRLRQVLDALGIRDLDVPDDLDGQAAVIRIAPMVVTEFEASGHTASLMQGPMPEVLLPAGLDLAKVGGIGLRKLGMPAIEAQDFAKAIDWRTTLIVPVPPTASSFRQVLVGSSRGVVIEGQRLDPDTGVVRGNWNLLLWSRDGRVFAQRTTMRLREAMAMANSLP